MEEKLHQIDSWCSHPTCPADSHPLQKAPDEGCGCNTLISTLSGAAASADCCRQYKVYDMTSDYRLLFTLPASNIAELKLGSQYLLLLQTQPGSTPPLTATPAHAADTHQQQHHSVVVGYGGAPAAPQCRSSSLGVLREEGPVRKSVRLQVYAVANGQVRSQGVLGRGVGTSMQQCC
jgi:hypothetical protein